MELNVYFLKDICWMMLTSKYFVVKKHNIISINYMEQKCVKDILLINKLLISKIFVID